MKGETMNKIEEIRDMLSLLRGQLADPNYSDSPDSLLIKITHIIDKILDLLDGEVLIKDITDIPMWSSKAKIDYLGKK